MADLALIASADPLTGMPVFDIGLTPIPDGAMVVARDVSLDDGLNTAVYISLFTDARADQPVDPDDQRGWWGDEFGQVGSQLWLLTRGKVTDEALSNAKAWTEESLAWLVDDGVASSVNVRVTRISLHAISIIVQITKPSGNSETFKYALNWAATA